LAFSTQLETRIRKFLDDSMLCGDDDGRAPKLIQEWIANELAYKPLSAQDLLPRGIFLLGCHFANAVERPI